MALAAKADDDALAPMAAGNNDAAMTDTNDMRAVQTSTARFANRPARRAAMAAGVTATAIAKIIEAVLTKTTMTASPAVRPSVADFYREARGVESDGGATRSSGSRCGGKTAQRKRGSDESGFEHVGDHETNSFS